MLGLLKLHLLGDMAVATGYTGLKTVIWLIPYRFEKENSARLSNVISSGTKGNAIECSCMQIDRMIDFLSNLCYSVAFQQRRNSC